MAGATAEATTALRCTVADITAAAGDPGNR
jgi:hypothetical protein